MNKTLEFFRELHHTAHLAQQIGDKVFFREEGLTGMQYGILENIYEAGGSLSGVNQLDHYEICTPANLTGMIDRLENANLVKRAQDPKDRRKQLILLTDEGKRKYKKLRSQIAKEVINFEKATGDISFEKLTKELKKIKKVFNHGS